VLGLKRVRWPDSRRREMSVEIIGSTRSSIRVRVGGKTTTLTGEGMPTGGAVHFYADRTSIMTWDNGFQITDSERDRIVRELPGIASRTGFVVVVD
jgi:Immunity protein 74